MQQARATVVQLTYYYLILVLKLCPDYSGHEPLHKGQKQTSANNFPKNSPLHQIINTNTIKLSYRTCKNMESELARHNNLLLQNEDDQPPPPRCNCQAALKPNCPLPGYCTVSCVVYKAEVTEGDQSNPATQIVQTYTGLTENPVKKM